MDLQLAFNIAMALAGGLGGWVLKSITNKLEQLGNTDSLLRDKIQEIEVLVAGKYVKHEDLDKMTSAIFAKLERIENKLDSKQDKP